MVYTIYLDVIFILDFIIDYLLLYATAKISGAQIRRRRLVLAGIFGATASVVSLYCNGYFTFLLMVSVAIVMVGISYGFLRWRLVLVFFGASAAFGGMVFAIDCIFGGNLTISLKTLALATVLSYVIMVVAFRKSATGTTKKEQVHIEIENETGKATFYALVDSGNSLCDPVTNTPVLIAEVRSVKELFEDEIFKMLDEVTIDTLLLKSRGFFRPIPFKSVGGGGILPAFRPKSVLVDGKKRDILVAVTREKVGGNEGYEGIIGLEED